MTPFFHSADAAGGGARRTFICGVTAFLGFLLISPGVSAGCSLESVHIEPETQNERSDIYLGKTKFLELRFRNEKTDGLVEVFPEPPVVIRQLATPVECVIDEGGIWVRRHVYASDDGHVVVTNEYSGSNEDLVFYETRTCEKRASIDVSNAKWVIKEKYIHIFPSARQPYRIKLNRNCLPVDLPRASHYR